MEIEGFIYKVFEPMTGTSKSTGNAWMSQEFILGYYWYPNQTQPSYMSCRMFGKDKVTSSNLQPNDEVQIKFSVEARESSTGRWFNDVRAWAVNRNIQPAPGMPVAAPMPGAPMAAAPAAAAPAAAAAPFPPAQEPADTDNGDGLPF